MKSRAMPGPGDTPYSAPYTVLIFRIPSLPLRHIGSTSHPLNLLPCPAVTIYMTCTSLPCLLLSLAPREAMSMARGLQTLQPPLLGLALFTTSHWHPMASLCRQRVVCC